MKGYLRQISPRGAIMDLIHEWRAPNPHRWQVLGVSVAATFTMIVVLVPDSQRIPPRKPEVTWITTFAPGRSDAEIVASTVAQLRRLYGDVVTEPTSAIVTRWQDDPFSRGSYAYMLPGSVGADHDDLAEPVGGVLHLAGEATWGDDPATVPGAMLSGHRAAQNALGRDIPVSDLWA